MNCPAISRFILTALAAGLLSLHAPVQAQGQTGVPAGSNAGDTHRGPPPEAIAACRALKMEQACSFTSLHGVMSGICWQPDAGKPLACRPAHAGTAAGGDKPGGDKQNDEKRGPPAESLAACNGHKLNDACAFTSPKGAENGTCFQPDASKPLACRPTRKP